MTRPLHERLLDAGIPVIVCRPHEHYAKCEPDCRDEITPESGWQTITAAKARTLIGKYRPGIDTLAMVGGHGIDVLDIDTKATGDPGAVPASLQLFGRTRTPSGGWHFPVPSTGYGKGSLYINGVYQGDYVGGTKAGGSRLLAFLPGSSRPKYPDGEYVEVDEWQIDALLNAQPGPTLLALCAASSLSTTGKAGRKATSSAEAKAFLKAHADPVACAYGQAALDGVLDAATTIVAGDKHNGRHAWAARSTNRVVELIKAGCLDASAFEKVREELQRRKPDGGTNMDGLLTWAIANADGGTNCATHGEALTAWTPEPLPDAIELDEAREVFARWLGAEYDLDALHFTLALVAIERLDGDAPWGLIVSGPGNAKTETVSAAAGAGAHVTSTITSEGALLSATSKREQTRDATGGLLRKLGDRGVLVIKDVTSILSMNRDALNAVLGAMREVADGKWERNVGTDGGKTLTWAGRLVTIGAVTTAWDTHHGVIAKFGDRFVLLRIDSSRSSTRLASGRQSLANIGHEDQMRAELRTAFGGVIAGMATDGIHVNEDEGEVLLTLANIVTLARTGVERDHQGNVVDAHAPEAPTRLVKHLGQIMRGGIAVGMDRFDALRLAVRVAHDCVPPLRLAALREVRNQPGGLTADLARGMQKPRTSVDRVLQELHLLGLVEVSSDATDTRWRYRISAEVDAAALGDLIDGGRPFTRNVTTSTQEHREVREPESEPEPEAHPDTDISGDLRRAS